MFYFILSSYNFGGFFLLKSLDKAIAVVTRAVENDQNKNYVEAYHLYCKALQYFVPLINAEYDSTIRQHLRAKAITYLNRAEEIKMEIISKREQEMSSNNTNSSPSISKVLEPHFRFNALCKIIR